MAWKLLPAGSLLVLLGILVPTCWTRIYTNHWAVRIKGGAQEADRIAGKYGYINMGKVMLVSCSSVLLAACQNFSTPCGADF